jgi:hypothetical protein
MFEDPIIIIGERQGEAIRRQTEKLNSEQGRGPIGSRPRFDTLLHAAQEKKDNAKYA